MSTYSRRVNSPYSMTSALRYVMVAISLSPMSEQYITTTSSSSQLTDHTYTFSSYTSTSAPRTRSRSSPPHPNIAPTNTSTKPSSTMNTNTPNTQNQPGLVAAHAEYIKGATEVRLPPSPPAGRQKS